MEERGKKSKIVPFEPDAAFFFERGVRYLNRHDLSRALKSFERAVQCEPSNAVNHCNLAGVLSELGDFEKSNEILHSVLTDLAPEMAECYFYMANNYANLGEYELAEEHVVKYLEVDPTGEFAPDADEMLDVLIHEFGGGDILRESRRKQHESTKEHDLARTLLEEGKFHEAIGLLAKEIELQPEAVAARNNLALAKYYLGHVDAAIELTREVLELEPMNVHALCNLAVFIRQRGEHEEYRQLISLLTKLMPLQFDQGYKLATTLGILGEHQAAYRIFLQLVQFGDRHDPTLYFALAAASANQHRLKQAKQWLLEVQALDPDSGIADYYLQEMDRGIEKGDRVLLSYSYQLPFHLRSNMNAQVHSGAFAKVGAWAKDPSVRSSLYFALFRGPRATKREALQALAVLHDTETIHILRDFVKDPTQGEDMIWNGLFVLQMMHVIGSIDVYMGGQMTTIQLPTKAEHMLSWNPTLEAVFRDVQSAFTVRDSDLIDVAYDIWVRYLMNVYSDLPKIVKRSVWSAALEYVVRRTAGRTEPQAIVASRYEVSVKALAKAAQAITVTL
ncbi:tetratricopeptide repeat protein [Sulfoacidibacillus ferrooxidans]|uniref:Beta-barrel assembly-enhancing protease n=1 Tax=Sulfoacidibacillus ferrooxidans TaxID=2005001 RepID=A0A9X1V7S1_9BACL|nr:tetratricopeptide repeat protein [Sulfoacidibacillus ferrooxidans]MCI0182747.1 Beta-barrel assembly-enhancing protease [Sulfoacidibacillus ferrooxidans]